MDIAVADKNISILFHDDQTPTEIVKDRNRK